MRWIPPKPLWWLVLGLSLPLVAAESPPDESPAPAPQPAETDAEANTETMTTAERDAALAEEIRAAEAEAANAPPADPNEPFVPSVQISEDLSVSFPVDI